MNINDFLLARSQKFSEHLRSRGVDLPEKFSLRHLVRSLGSNLLAMDADPSDAGPEIHEGEMSAKFIVSTPCKDRMGDIVIPRGCLKRLANYQRNPVAFFSHRSTEIPIGTTRRSPTSPVEVEVLDDQIIAKIYFHGLTAESELIFKLVKAGVLRATSIGFIPHIAALIREQDDEDQDDKNGLGEHLIYFGDNRVKQFPSLRFHDWELTEISVVPVPANPEALSMHLSRGHIEGQIITPSIRKGLESYATPLPIWSPGALLDSISPSPEVKSLETPNPMNLIEVEVAPGVLAPIQEVKIAEMPGEPTPAPTVVKEDPYAGWSHGAKVLDSYVSKMNEIHCYMSEQCSVLDQPKIKRYTEKKMERILRDVHKLKKLGSSLYPEKFEDPGEMVEKAIDPALEVKKDVVVPVVEAPVVEVVVVEEKAVETPSLVEALNLEKILQGLQEIATRCDAIDEKFYEITGK